MHAWLTVRPNVPRKAVQFIKITAPGMLMFLVWRTLLGACRVHGDTKHPKAKEIYEKLDKVALKIKEIGYVPNTDLVLHEVEDEQKEQYLFQHSEKIALAFGLISTSKQKPIRIFKNRVWRLP
ncbi:hypothetical protein HAX54_042500 [Datura stramonium]|uniref:DYW domain-containing protein n=1 Tax=Datura stramonium TaxID=4076 RepID=A0ABS8W397_DATST|nr:hypothetical protein [Datura stramonium]